MNETAGDAARVRLGADQARLIAALAADGPLPEGIDPERAELARISLRQKRRRSLRRAWPQWDHALGDRADALLDAYFADCPRIPAAGPLADGLAAVAWLGDRGAAPDALRIEALRVRLRQRLTDRGAERRRGLRVAIGRRSDGGLLVAIAWPFVGRVTILGRGRRPAPPPAPHG